MTIPAKISTYNKTEKFPESSGFNKTKKEKLILSFSVIYKKVAPYLKDSNSIEKILNN